MTKRLFLLAFVGAILSSLFGCSQDDPGRTITPPAGGTGAQARPGAGKPAQGDTDFKP